MPLSLPVPDSSNSVQEITLNGIRYNFIYKFNEQDQSWRLGVFIGQTPVKVGEKIMPNQFLLNRYRLADFDHGDVACLRANGDATDLGRTNFGIGKSYEFVYYTNEELAAL